MRRIPSSRKLCALPLATASYQILPNPTAFDNPRELAASFCKLYCPTTTPTDASTPLHVPAHRPGDGAAAAGVERIDSQRSGLCASPAEITLTPTLGLGSANPNSQRSGLCSSPAEITLTPTPHGPVCRVRQLRVAEQRHGNACGYHCVHNLSLLLNGHEGLRQDLLDEQLVSGGLLVGGEWWVAGGWWVVGGYPTVLPSVPPIPPIPPHPAT